MDLNFKNFLNHLKERDLLEIIIKSHDEAKKQAPYNKNAIVQETDIKSLWISILLLNKYHEWLFGQFKDISETNNDD